MLIYVARNGERLGPYERSELDDLLKKEGQTPAPDFYWHEGLSGWEPFEHLPAEPSEHPVAEPSERHSRKALLSTPPAIPVLSAAIFDPIPQLSVSAAEIAPEGPTHASERPEPEPLVEKIPAPILELDEPLVLPLEVDSTQPEPASVEETAAAEAPSFTAPLKPAELKSLLTEPVPSPFSEVTDEGSSPLAAPAALDVLAPPRPESSAPDLSASQGSISPQAPFDSASPTATSTVKVYRLPSPPPKTFLAEKPARVIGAPLSPARQAAGVLVAAVCGSLLTLAALYPRLDFLSGKASAAAAAPSHHLEGHVPYVSPALASELWAKAEKRDRGEDGRPGNSAEAMALYKQAAQGGFLNAQWTLANRYRNGVGVLRSDAEAARWLKLAAAQGHMQSQVMLGFMYKTGQGVTRNASESVHWYQMAADKGDVDACYQVGMAHEQGAGVAQDFSLAAKWLAKAAGQDHAPAQYALGELYHRGQGVQQDEAQAFSWYEKGARQGYFSAQYALGQAYLLGQGTKAEPEEAAKWFTIAAEQGDSDAQRQLADLYRGGQGLPKQYTRALQWYTKAAEQGDAQAQFALGRAFLRGEGMDRSLSEAAKWLRQAADQGVVIAQAALGKMYREGRGLARSDEQAFKWYQLAAKHRMVEAQAALADMYRKGEGAPKDDKLAFHWFQKAAEGGHTHAMLALAQACEAGRGTEKSDGEALQWYRKAAEAGDPDAQYLLAYHYDSGKGNAQDPAQAVEWYRRAAEQGDRGGQSQVGFKYMLGSGVAKDLVQARYWLSLAAAKDDSITLSDALQKLDGQLTKDQLAEAKRLQAEYAPKPEPLRSSPDTLAMLFTPVTPSLDLPANPNPATADLIKGKNITTGTGFFVDRFGHILTAYHLIQGSANVRVRMEDGTEKKAHVVKVDATNDLALLSVPGSDHPSLLLSSPKTEAKAGAAVFTIGYPIVPETQGLEAKFLDGKLDPAVGKEHPHHLQATLPMQPGLSGSPLLDTRGCVLGLVLPDPSSDGPLQESAQTASHCMALKSSAALTFVESALEARDALPKAPEITPDKLPATPAPETVQAARQASVLILAEGGV